MRYKHTSAKCYGQFLLCTKTKLSFRVSQTLNEHGRNVTGDVHYANDVIRGRNSRRVTTKEGKEVGREGLRKL